MGKLAGKFQGGWDKGSSPKQRQEGYRGRGTMPFKTMNHPTNQKDIIAGETQRARMIPGRPGRVLYSSANKRRGRQEGTGQES